MGFTIWKSRIMIARVVSAHDPTAYQLEQLLQPTVWYLPLSASHSAGRSLESLPGGRPVTEARVVLWRDLHRVLTWGTERYASTAVSSAMRGKQVALLMLTFVRHVTWTQLSQILLD